MNDQRHMEWLPSLRERWIARGILNGQPATEADVATFEARYGVVLPSDLRAYFTTLNGTAVGAYGMQDEHLLGFWHLDEVRSFAELFAQYGPTSIEQAQTFVIADHSIWVYGFGIQLSSDPEAATRIVVDIGSPYHRVAGTFSEFVEAYLRGSTDVIYPDPNGGPSSPDAYAV